MTTLAFSGTGDAVLKITDNNDRVLTIIKAHIVDYYDDGKKGIIIAKTNGDIKYMFSTQAELDAAITLLDSAF